MNNLRKASGIIFLISLVLLIDAWFKQKPKIIESAPQTIKEINDLDRPQISQDLTQNLEQRPETSDVNKTENKFETYEIENSKVVIEFSSYGAQINKVIFKEYKDRNTKKPLSFLELNENYTFVAQSGFISESLPSHSDNFVLNSNKTLTNGNQEITFELRKPGFTLKKKYTIEKDSYLIKVFHSISGRDINKNEPIYLRLLRDDKIDSGKSMLMPTFSGAAIYTAEEKYQKVKLENIKKGKDKHIKVSDNGWIGYVQQYFVAAIIPPKDEKREYFTRFTKNNKFAIGLMGFGNYDDKSVTYEHLLYIGPQIQKEISEISEGLDLTVDYSWLTIIASPLFNLLFYINSLVGNWGLAIIILTFIIKLIFFPLSAASYKSMAKMKKLSPQLMKLKESYGDDKMKMQQSMMELYKKEKINPLGGCLPILVQIPVFIALYWVLLGSVELREAPFYFWIKDLSVKDPFYVLPILMAISMIAQTYLNPTPPDPVQAKIMKIMPFVFSIFFFFFPAGLVLYWLINNILSILQQWYITKNLEAKKN